jgi:hypothetical protein
MTAWPKNKFLSTTRGCAVLFLTCQLALPSHMFTTPVSAVSARTRQASGNSSPSASSNTQSLEAGYWRTDGNFESTLRVKNALVVSGITVTPVLFMRDGTEFDLVPIQLPAAGTAEVNLNEALLKVPQSVAPHVSDFGSAAIRFQYRTNSVVDASIAILNKPQSLSFVIPFQHFPDAPAGEQVLDGLWWKHDAGVGGFVAVANTTDGPVAGTVRGLDSHGTPGPIRDFSLAPHETEQLRLDELLEDLPIAENKEGGIRVVYSGKPGDLYVEGGLLNEAEGYSAAILFWAHGGENDHAMHDSSGAAVSGPTELTYASVGIMVGEPNPMMMFPPGTVFDPYAVLRNTTESPISVRLAVNFMAGGKPEDLTLPPQTMGPLEARQLPLRDMLEHAGLRDFSGMINLTLKFQASPSELLVSIGLVDKTGR